MKSTIFAAATTLLSLAVPALCAPAPRPFRTLVSRNATTTTTSPPFSVTETLFPDLQVAWSSKTPNQKGLATKRGHLLTSPWEQVHTAVHFYVPPGGGTCKLVFRLSVDDSIVAQAGPAVFDIYRLDACLNEGYAWAGKPTRGIHAGIVTPVKGGAAAWEGVDMSADYYPPVMSAAPTFTCQEGEYSFEMIARDGANIGWTSGRGSGLSIEICGKDAPAEA